MIDLDPPGWTRVATLHRSDRGTPILPPTLLGCYPRALDAPWLMLPEHPLTFHRVCLPARLAAEFTGLRRVLEAYAPLGGAFPPEVARAAHALVILVERYGCDGTNAIVGAGAEVLWATLVTLGAWDADPT